MNLSGLAMAKLLVSRNTASSMTDKMIFHLHFLSIIEMTSLHFID